MSSKKASLKRDRKATGVAGKKSGVKSIVKSGNAKRAKAGVGASSRKSSGTKRKTISR